jgi:hypothetical protein
VHLAEYMCRGLTRFSSILGLNSVAYSGGLFCVDVHLFTGYSYVGFSNRWLVSLTRGQTFESEHAKQSVVESQLPDLKE